MEIKVKPKVKKPKYFVVYTVVYNLIPIYIGYTGVLKARQYQHNRLFKKGYKKELYTFLRSVGFEGEIELIPIKAFKTKIEAKRWECYMILQDYFGNLTLKQKVPNISDR